ncbi:axonemal dynein light intermediate polypeptide 1-like isoform X1 [Labrus mixtus]|uniref:axonemal dynein light intermediate polypeptide 1-like isoform X1 n=1 Tax=Labrus mixtus TaxID=508554 RepID=UPI0029BFC325|nr:axonemal dynein light intermediate polypeptide 1-like isoform X1 [Labrus mixtus]
MNPPAESLLKYDRPVLIRKSTDRKSPKGRPLKVSPQQVGEWSTPVPPPPKSKPTSTDTTKQEDEEILNAILPPREWTEGTQLWVQKVSSAPCTRTDVIDLEELLDTKLYQRQARQTGICPVCRELYSQCFDELIRQVTIRCAESGQLLSRVRDEIQMTIPVCQTLYESGVAFGMRKALQSEQGKVDMEKKITDLDDEKLELKKQLNELKSQCDAIEKQDTESGQIEEKMHEEEIQFLKRSNLELKVTFQDFIPQKYIFPLHLFL